MSTLKYQAVSGLNEQKGYSREGYSCRYRAQNGNKCAVGMLIKDEDYTPERGSTSFLQTIQGVR